ncbi:MAG: putative aminopeptidase [Planctomycetota bacterium]|nr:putative aminopeptidase [Planctomycetota bacterium]
MLPSRSRFLRCFAALAAPFALAVSAASLVAEDYVSPAQARLRADITYLAHDDREGRGPGTKGIDAAADYIAASFKDAGLTPPPGGDGYFQYFDLPGERKLGENAKLVVNVKKDGDQTIKAALKSDFSPLALGGPADIQGVPVVFAGYGITAKDEALKLDYDDYDGLDVKDKAVLIIRREPQVDKADSLFGGKENTTYATFNHKVANAVKHGAKAVLLVNDAATAKETKDALLDFQAAGGFANNKLAFVMISRDLANKILKAGGQPSLEDVEGQIDSDLKPRSTALDGVQIDASVSVENKGLKVKNVIGVLEGAGPLAEETIVLGAHYDHLGFGGSGSLAFGNRSIHNGADDNASGTSMVMEMARRLAKRVDPLPRRVVFMAFSAEERGLIGSQYYVNHPLFPLKQTVAMINFDMVGRLNKNSDLTVFGTGTSPGLDTLVELLCRDQGLKAKNVVGTQGEFFQSDHASFYMKDMPVVFFFTGTHPDYHRPSDDTHLINFDGMARIADVGELLTLDLVRRPERLKFTKLGRAPTVASGAGRGGSNAYLGSRPSYGESPEGGGVKLDGVSEGSPAEKAGLKEGDVIIKFAGKDVKDIEGYMAAMSGNKPGDEVDIVVKRDGKETTLKAKLGARPGGSPKN